MAKNPHREYFEFYLQGRDEASDDGAELDIDYAELGKRVVAGESVRDVAMETAKKHCKELWSDGQLLVWKKSSRRLRQDIDAAGGDASRAYNLYCTGFVDEIATEVEGRTLEAIAAEDEEEDEDEAEEEDEEEDEDEDEDEGDLVRRPS